jgi:hypothetical protein
MQESPQIGRRIDPPRASHQFRTVASMLTALGYSLQGTRKTKEGSAHPDRNAQFEYIHHQVEAFQQRGQPVVSVDTKKKELVGDFTNGGCEYQPIGQPEPVRVYDFVDKDLGKAIPSGIYDMTANQGWVSVGTDHDTAQFAVATLRRWWQHMGGPAYPHAHDLLIIADGGGSNGSRSRLWKVELQGLADKSGLKITVGHLSPGTSKWNKIEHRMFCHITENWRGRPLISHAVIVNLIAHTTTQTGLHIHAVLDTAAYPTGLTVTDDQMKALKLEPASFHGTDWNYTIKPRAIRTLVSAKSGDFLPSQAIGRKCENALPTPMSLHALGQMRRHRCFFPQWTLWYGDLRKIHAQ